MNNRTHLHVLFSALTILACNPENNLGNDSPKSADYKVSGKVEKGPFVSGSTINLQPLDAKYNAVGTNFHSEIVDNAGNFSLGEMTLDTPYATMTANGYFFNEVTGALSKGTLSLNAIVDLTNKSTVNVNLLTHLKYYRVQKLLSTGMTFKDADTQAQNELFDAFGLGQFNTSDVSQYSITAGTDQAGALIAISSLLLVNRSEASITEFLANLSKEFGDNGFFAVETKDKLHESLLALSDKTSGIAGNIVKRYEDLGETVTVKDLALYFDWDGNGVVGDEIIPEGTTVTADQSKISVPVSGGTYTVKINSPVPVFLTPPSTSGELTPSDGYTSDTFFNSIYDIDVSAGIKLQTSILNNVISIEVEKTTARSLEPVCINVYDYFGRILLTITVEQEADTNGEIPKLSSQGEQYIAGVFSAIADGLSAIDQLERLYSHNSSYGNLPVPMDPNNSMLYQTWSNLYVAFNRLNQFRDAEARVLNVYGPYLDFFAALSYLPMMELWGDVPYLMTSPSMDTYSIPRTSMNDILGDLVSRLEKTLEVTEDSQKYGCEWTTANELFFMPKNFVKVLLSKLYMKLGKYEKAIAYLQAVQASEFYYLDEYCPSTSVFIGGEQETTGEHQYMFGMKRTVQTKSGIDQGEYIIIFSYGEVLLSLAECKYKLGDEAGALALVNKVGEVHGWEQQVTGGKQVISYILQLRKEQMYPGMFGFLKRNELTKDELGISNENYLLLPIPYQELMTNSAMTQNPGY